MVSPLSGRSSSALQFSSCPNPLDMLIDSDEKKKLVRPWDF
jgi:hypothetical protein